MKFPEVAIKLDVTVIGSSRCLGDAISAHELGDKISARLSEMCPVKTACPICQCQVAPPASNMGVCVQIKSNRPCSICSSRKI